MELYLGVKVFEEQRNKLVTWASLLLKIQSGVMTVERPVTALIHSHRLIQPHIPVDSMLWIFPRRSSWTSWLNDHRVVHLSLRGAMGVI